MLLRRLGDLVKVEVEMHAAELRSTGTARDRSEQWRP
jgi:hypothetical protein